MSENIVDSIKSSQALKDLGGLVPSNVGGGDLISGALPLVMGMMQGTTGAGASSSTPETLNNKKREQEFITKVMGDVNSEDQRIPKMLEKVGDIAGGKGEGDNWKKSFEELPDIIKNVLQTAFNSSPLGSLTGGSPSSFAQASVGMLKGTNQFTNPGGLDLGGQFSPQRRALAGDVNKEMMGFFQDQNTGVPIMERTQGQSFDNIAKFTQSMAEQGGIKSKDLISGIGESGNIEVNEKGMDSAKKNVKKGMELFRNLTDVFGSTDFNELMKQAERLGGLNLADPSSIGKSLSTIRNARGLATSIGMDERKALGHLAEANDTMVAMGVDRRTAAAFNGQSFTGAMMQGMRNIQEDNPFDNTFRRRMGPEQLMQNAAIANTALLAEGEGNALSEVSMSQQLRMFKAKPRASSDALNSQIDAALEEQDPEKRKRLMRSAIGSIREETGIDTVQMAKQLGLGKMRETMDSDTLDEMAQDTRRVLLTRNKQRFKQNFMDFEFNTARFRGGVQEGFEAERDMLMQDPETQDLLSQRNERQQELQQLRKRRDSLPENDTARSEIEDQMSSVESEIQGLSESKELKAIDSIEGRRRETMQGLQDFENLMVNSTNFGGLESLSKLAGIAEGKDGNVQFFDDEQNKMVTMNARDMDDSTKLEAITQKLEAQGVEGQEAQRVAEVLMQTPDMIQSVRSMSGMSVNDASSAMANLAEQIGLDPSMTQFLIGDQAIEAGVEAGSKGAASLMGGPAMTDPLQNLIFGIMGADEKALTDRAFEESGSERQRLSVNALTTTDVQRELFSSLAETNDPEERSEIAGREGTRRAMADLTNRIIPKLEEVELGDSNLLEKSLEAEGIENPAEAIDNLKKDMAQAAKLERIGDKEGAAELRERNMPVVQALLSQVGGDGSQATMKILDTIRDAGGTTRSVQLQPEEVEAEMAKLKGASDFETLQKMTEQRDQLSKLDELEKQEANVEELRANVDETAVDRASNLRREADNLLTEEDKDLLADRQGGSEVQEARDFVRKFQDESSNFRKRVESSQGSEEAAMEEFARQKDIIAEFDESVSLAQERQQKASELRKEADEMEAPNVELAEAEKSLEALQKQTEGFDRESIDTEIRDTVNNLIMDEEEDVSQEERDNLAEFAQQASEEEGRALTPQELISRLEASEEEGAEQLLATANEVFDTEEVNQIEELNRRKESGSSFLEIASDGQAVEDRKDLLRSSEFQEAEKTKDLVTALGLDEDAAKDVMSQFEEADEVGKTEETLRSELAELEEGRTGEDGEELKPLSELSGDEKAQREEAIAAKKEEIEKVKQLGSIDDVKDNLFTLDLAGTQGDKENDLISQLADKGEGADSIIETFEGAGISKTEMLDQINAAEQEFRNSLGGDQPAEGSAEAERLREFEQAQQEIKNSMTSDDTSSLLVDLLDYFRKIGNGNSINVKLQK